MPDNFEKLKLSEYLLDDVPDLEHVYPKPNSRKPPLDWLKKTNLAFSDLVPINEGVAHGVFLTDGQRQIPAIARETHEGKVVYELAGKIFIQK